MSWSSPVAVAAAAATVAVLPSKVLDSESWSSPVAVAAAAAAAIAAAVAALPSKVLDSDASMEGEPTISFIVFRAVSLSKSSLLLPFRVRRVESKKVKSSHSEF